MLYRIIFKFSGTEPDFFHMTKLMKGRKNTRRQHFCHLQHGSEIQETFTNQTPFPYSCNNNEVVLISRIMKMEFEMIVYKINAKTENIKAV